MLQSVVSQSWTWLSFACDFQGHEQEMSQARLPCEINQMKLPVQAFPAVLAVENLPASAGDARDMGLILGSGRCPGGQHGNPLQCAFLENPMDRGGWRATVHGVAQGWS